MTDLQILTVASDGTRGPEDAAQLVGRVLVPVGDGVQTIPQALADRPTQADVARAIQGAALGTIDLTDLQAGIAGAQATAGAALAAAGGSVQRGGIVGPDADWPIPAGTVHVVVPAITATRTWSLPDVDGYPAGQDLVVVDEGRFLGAGPSLLIVPLAGSGDSIAGYPSGLTLADAGASVRLRRGLLSDVWVLV